MVIKLALTIFLILLKENNAFKLILNESLLVSCVKQILNIFTCLPWNTLINYNIAMIMTVTVMTVIPCLYITITVEL